MVKMIEMTKNDQKWHNGQKNGQSDWNYQNYQNNQNGQKLWKWPNHATQNDQKLPKSLNDQNIKISQKHLLNSRKSKSIQKV